MKIYYLGKKFKETEIRSGGDRYAFEVFDYLDKNADLTFLDISDRNWSATFSMNINSILTSLGSNLWAINKLRNVKKGTVILTNVYYKKFFFIFTWVARYLKRCKLVIGVNAFYYKSRRNKFLNQLDKYMMWVFLKPASIIIANSEAAKEALVQLGLRKTKIEVVYPRIHLPPDLPEFTKDKNRSKLEIVYVGHPSLYRKTHILIEALGKVSELDFQLHLAGDPQRNFDYFQKIRKMVLDYGIRDKVNFHGILKGADLSLRYKNADILVSTIDIEAGIGRAVIEGMHFGVVPVVADRAASREFIEDGVSGFLYPANDAASLADLILKLYNNKVLLEKVGENAGESSKKANFDRNIGKEVFNLISRHFEDDLSSV